MQCPVNVFSEASRTIKNVSAYFRTRGHYLFKAHHWTRSWWRWMQSTSLNRISLTSILILSSQIGIRRPIGLSLKNFQTKILIIYHHSNACYIPRPSCPPSFDLPNIFDDEYKLWSSSKFSFLQPHVTSCSVQIFSSLACNVEGTNCT
jgi:hypothetical protein